MEKKKEETIALQYALKIGLNTVGLIDYNNRPIYSLGLIIDGMVVPTGLPFYVEIINGHPIKLVGSEYKKVQLFLQKKF